MGEVISLEERRAIEGMRETVRNGARIIGPIRAALQAGTQPTPELVAAVDAGFGSEKLAGYTRQVDAAVAKGWYTLAALITRNLTDVLELRADLAAALEKGAQGDG